MKKFFSTVIAVVAAMAMNATDYYFAGAANSWSNNKEAWKFVEVEGVLTLEVADLYGEFKIAENGSWHPQHGAAAAGEGVALEGSYNLVKCDGEHDAPANANVLIADSMGYAEPRYKDAKLTLDASDPDNLVINFVAGTLYDHAAAPKTYQLVGACTDNWSTDAAVQFEPVEGVLTATVADLNGTFKIIQDRAWTNQWATNWENGGGVAVGVPYVLGAKGENGEPSNLSLANPFGGYHNAVLTLTGMGEGETPTLTLVSGDFYMGEVHWYFPGSKLGWNCNENTEFAPVSGKENTYEFAAPELNKDFKVVFGVWGVEFGAPKGDENFKWSANKEFDLATPCDNFHPLFADLTYIDVTVTIVVDYENIAVKLLIESETEEPAEAIANKTLNGKAAKAIVGKDLVIIKNGVRYNVLGARF